MPLILCGIDEAGYGPLLGPLCVAAATFRIDDWSPGDPAPDLWKRMARGVCRSPSDRRRRIAIDDSKKLKLPNSSGTRHPLTYLERAVLAALALRDRRPATDAELLDELGCAAPAGPDALPWYRCEASPIPLAWTAPEIAIAANTLASAAGAGGVTLIDLRCRAVPEHEFNAAVRATGTKAAAGEHVIRAAIANAWHRDAVGLAEPAGPRIVCDRQGGRIAYGAMLSAAVPEADVRTVEESARRSRYELVPARRDAGPRHLSVIFQPEAESDCLAVALASMTAKLVRELYMARFNRFWCARMPELKPTAGYREDARRWLRDAEPVLTPADLETLIRIA